MELDREKLLRLYPEYDTVFGPYQRKDGRYHIVLYKKGNNTQDVRKTISYPKALVECEIERRLEAWETVDHQDRDYNNNNLTNFVIRSKREHISLDVKRVRCEKMSCPICGTVFELSVGQRNDKKNRAGPFCSKHCSGKYGADVQNGGQYLDRNPVIKEFYRLEKEYAPLRK